VIGPRHVVVPTKALPETLVLFESNQAYFDGMLRQRNGVRPETPHVCEGLRQFVVSRSAVLIVHEGLIEGVRVTLAECAKTITRLFRATPL